MKIHFLLALSTIGGVAFGANVSLKAQHAISASSTIFAVQTTKNTSAKGNMLSVRQNSAGALAFSAPTIEVNSQIVSPGDSMLASSAVSAGATGVVTYGYQALEFIGDGGGSDFSVDGTPDVGPNGAAVDIQVACLDSDPSTGDWVTVDTITDENLHSGMTYEAVSYCVGELAGTPVFRAIRGSLKSNSLGFPW